MPEWLRFTLFGSGAFFVLFGAALFVHSRVSKRFHLSKRARVVLGAALGLGVSAMFVGRMFRRTGFEYLGGPLYWVGSVLMLALMLSAFLLLPIELARGGARLARWRPRSMRNAAREAHPPDEDDAVPAPTVPRRDFILQAATGTALAMGCTSSLYGSVFGRHDYQIDEVAVRLAGMSPGLSGFTVVQLSDIHFGAFVGAPEARAAEHFVRRARPDLIVLTGDLVDRNAEHARRLGTLVERLRPLARHGVVAVPGNHDYYAGIDVVLDTLRRAGARVLRNDGVIVGEARHGFALLGVDDVWAPRVVRGAGPNLERAIAAVQSDLPRLLLCHNPVFFPEAAPHVQLQLSGHTHGGQVNFVVRPAEVVLAYGYVAGMYERGDSSLYVNRGFGTAGPPARIGAPPEVTRIVLTA